MTIKKPYLTLMLMIVLSSLTTTGYSQTAKWDSTYRPATFQNKVEQFKSYSNSPTDIIFLGNSLTANTDWCSGKT